MTCNNMQERFKNLNAFLSPQIGEFGCIDGNTIVCDWFRCYGRMAVDVRMMDVGAQLSEHF